MKKWILICLIAIFPFLVKAQQQKIPYNQKLADSLGADQLGMKNYVLVVLKTGPKPDVSQEIRDGLIKGHFGFINGMSEKGLLLMAGPLEKNDKQYRGIYIFNVKNVEEARVMVQTDPSIRAGYFEVELYGLYGSAALPMLVPIHRSIQKSNPQ
jgi:uncharacterized protein YciI